MSKLKVEQKYTYSGVLDENGVEIKDGDVVVPHWGGMKPGIVTFKDGAFRWGITKLVISSWMVSNFHLTVDVASGIIVEE
jgi:hypothetical protein